MKKWAVMGYKIFYTPQDTKNCFYTKALSEQMPAENQQ